MSEYSKFQYQPLEGKLSGKAFEQQTEDAINDMGERIVVAIESAQGAANAAQQASTAAREAAQNAEKAARESQEAAGRAQQAGEDAKEAADTVLEAVNSAKGASAKAQQAAETASSAASTASKAVQNAANAAESAEATATAAASSAANAERYAENIQTIVESLEIEDFDGATAEEAGARGYVPAPKAGEQNKVLTGGGSWATVQQALSGGLANPNVRQLLEALGLPYDHNSYFEEKVVATLNSSKDVDDFSNTYKIKQGDYGDLKVGNIIQIYANEIDGLQDWQIAGFDTEFRRGDQPPSTTTHHLSLIPHGVLLDKTESNTESEKRLFRRMNPTNTTAGGYAKSELHQWLNSEATGEIDKRGFITRYLSILGTHLVQRRVRLTTAVNATAPAGGNGGWVGASSATAWSDAKVTLMTEAQVYGGAIAASHYYDNCHAPSQLPFFRFKGWWWRDPHHARCPFWLTAVASSTAFADVGGGGAASAGGASGLSGVRPLIVIN